jgi:hypothetical protein
MQVRPEVPTCSVTESEELTFVSLPVFAQLRIRSRIDILYLGKPLQVWLEPSRSLKFTLPSEELGNHGLLNCLLNVTLSQARLL